MKNINEFLDCIWKVRDPILSTLVILENEAIECIDEARAMRSTFDLRPRPSFLEPFFSRSS
uniref:Uncharacterized protein n=1 Tax=Rhizophora mucronata TaxID=61149 RepID=A0A2P2QW72_RHIMU